MRKRRSVLKLAAGTTGLSTLFGVASAGSDTKLSGTTYDTLTHKTGPTANGRVTKTSNGDLQGQLNVGGYNLSLENVEMVESTNSRKRYVSVFDDQRYRKQGKSIKLDFFDYGDQLSGHVTRPGGDFGKLGFVLFDDQDFGPTERMLGSHQTVAGRTRDTHSKSQKAEFQQTVDCHA